MKGLFCPKCNTDTHVSKYEKDGLYVCRKCENILGYLCTGCDRVYLENRLAFHNNAYVCKICGTIQWGYTNKKREEI